MASSSGNSSGSTQIQSNSGSESDLMDQRKRKRMESNRESARRSRMRKQKHLDDLMSQMAQLRDKNDQIIRDIKLTTEQCVKFEFENSVLNAQMMELTQRLESLNDILSYMNTTNGIFDNQDFHEGFMNNNINFNPWNLMNLHQPIMASADMFQY